ncbi:MAG TPA: hypothetical protein VN325_38565 [Steroidobacteraceae bacterium]|nr:hypothetical protein [Steroidobacteraceae bacterium]
MSRTSTAFAAVAGVFAIALTACGGGGGGGGSAAPPPATTYDLQTGISNLVSKGLTSNVALSGTVIAGGNTVSFTGTGTLTLAPSVAATFNNSAAASQTQTLSGTVTASGQSRTFGPSSVVDYYASGTDAFLGEIGSSEYDVAQTPFTYPTMVVGGSAGTLGTISRYKDSTMSVSLGTTVVTYAVTAPVDPGSPVLVKLTNQIKDAQGSVTETDVTSYDLSSAGILTLVSASAQSAAGTLMATAQ